MSSTRAFRVAATSARLLIGGVVAVACVVGVSVAVAAPWPVVERTPAQAEVTPLPGDTVLVCNGGFRALGRVPADAALMTLAGTPALTVHGSMGDPVAAPLESPDFDGQGAAKTLTGVVEDRRAPLVAAAESVSLAAEDLAGLAAAPCREARSESWLVGGSVQVGSTDLVLLSNPGEVTATVALTVYGTAPGASSVIIPARSQVAVPLASIAPGEPAPVVKVSAEGSPIRAVLQSSQMRTLDPVGVDLQDAVPGTQQELVIAGVQVFAKVGDDAEATVLRMLAPDADAQADVLVRAADAPGSIASEYTVPLLAGVPTEVSLGDLEPGTYSVEIASPEPVVAAVRQQDGAGADTDFAWMAPAPEVDTEVHVAVPAGPGPRLHLVNDGDSDATVDLESLRNGDTQTITVPARSAVEVPVRQRTAYSVVPSAPVHLAVTMTGPGALAGWPLWAGPGATQTVTVYP